MRRLTADQPVAEPHIRECAGCGLLQAVPALRPGMTAQCTRCRTVLHRTTAHPITHSMALAAAGLVLLAILCLTPLMTVQTAGIQLTAGLFDGPAELVRRGMTLLALVVVFVVVVAPLAKLAGTLYVLVRLHEGQPPRHLRRVFAIVERLRPWSMIEVFVFGVFVAYVKLGDLVQITLDVGVYVLLALTVVLVWSDSAMDRDAIWDRLGGQAQEPPPSARLLQWLPGRAIGCETCGFINAAHGSHGRCRRCDSVLHRRKPNSVARTWALLLAAAVLYVPANYFPVLTVMQLGAGAPSTILGGVEELISSGMYPLAALVFFASIAVPMLKMIGMTIMLVTTQTSSAGQLVGRTWLYHVVCWVGRWSMIDIFMEALLGALVRFGTVITIEPGIGAVAFCAVVILTMLAAESFDPRLMWDVAEQRKKEAETPGDGTRAQPAD